MRPIKWAVEDTMRAVFAAVVARESAKARGVTDKRELDRIGEAAFDGSSNVILFPVKPRGGCVNG